VCSDWGQQISFLLFDELQWFDSLTSTLYPTLDSEVRLMMGELNYQRLSYRISQTCQVSSGASIYDLSGDSSGAVKAK